MKLDSNGFKNLSLLQLPDNMRTTDKLFIQNGILYKVFSDNSFISEKERNINFLIKNKVPNSPNIFGKLYDKSTFCGYEMEYIPNALSFRQAISEDIPMDKKIQAVKDIYEAMKFLHVHNIYIGDIHLDNMLITDNGGYLVDLEEVRFPGDEFKFKQYYLVRPNSKEFKINVPSRYTDNVKLMICSLSLLLGKDLETYVDRMGHDINLEELYHNVVLPLNNEDLSSYFEELMKGKFTEYFSDYFFGAESERKLKI